MPFEPGQSGNPKGRKPGTPNKITTDLKEMLREYVEGELADLDRLKEELSPRDRARLLAAVLPYVMPKMKAVEVSGVREGPVVVTLDLGA